MTREEAIKFYADEIMLLELAPTINGDNGSSMKEEWKRQADIHRLAIAALREQDNRIESDTVKVVENDQFNSCEYCNGSGKHFLVDDDIPFGSYNSIRLDGDKAFLDDADGFSIRIKFCPMCGRRLEEL